MAYFRCKFNNSVLPIEYLYNWDFTKSLYDKVQNKEITLIGNVTRGNDGLSFNDKTAMAEMFPDLIPTTPTEDIVLELDIGDMNNNFSNVGLIASFKQTAVLGIGYSAGYGRWLMINTGNNVDEFQNGIDLNNPTTFANSNLKIVFHDNVTLDIYKNDIHVGFCDYHTRYSVNNVFRIIGGYDNKHQNYRKCYSTFVVKKAKVYYQYVAT